MASLTPVELAAMRRKLAARHSPQTWNKPQVNAALQVVEDALVAIRFSVAADIEAAAPGVFNVVQKKLIGAFAIRRFADREES